MCVFVCMYVCVGVCIYIIRKLLVILFYYGIVLCECMALCVCKRCLYGVQTLLFVWCANGVVCMVCKRCCLYGVQTLLFVWCANVVVYMVYKRCCLYGVQTLLFVWCAHVVVCMVCTHNCFQYDVIAPSNWKLVRTQRASCRASDVIVIFSAFPPSPSPHRPPPYTY